MEIWNENFYHLKRETSWDYTITWVQLKAGNSIVICPAYTGKAVMVEDRETYLSKTQDQIHEGNYELLHFILDTYIIGIVICLKLILLFVISLMFMLYISKRCWITSESKRKIWLVSGYTRGVSKYTTQKVVWDGQRMTTKLWHFPSDDKLGSWWCYEASGEINWDISSPKTGRCTF